MGRSSADGNRSVLFLHGLGGAAASWRPQLDALAPSLRCLAWTMPGYGPSAPLPTTTIATLADAAVEVLDRFEVDRADVVGHSMGGYVAQELAVEHPERVGRLVLAATTAAFGKPGSEFNERFLAARLEPLDEGLTPADVAPALVDGLCGPDVSSAVRADAVASMSEISPPAYRRALEALVAWDGRQRLPSVTADTLCIAAERDETAPLRAMERLGALIPGSTLEVIAGCGHLLNNEAPAAFNRLLTNFLVTAGRND